MQAAAVPWLRLQLLKLLLVPWLRLRLLKLLLVVHLVVVVLRTVCSHLVMVCSWAVVLLGTRSGAKMLWARTMVAADSVRS